MLRFLLTLIFILLAACSSSENQNPVNSSKAGTDTGGGGFTDTYAVEALEFAKFFLLDVVEKSPDEMFSKLPKTKQKDWLAKLIKNIEYRDVDESRYGRTLKFNYDIKKEVVYATRHFSRTFPYGRSSTRPVSERYRIVTEVILDILHEISHFYGIGISEGTDKKSDEWAFDVLQNRLGEEFVCDDGKSVFVIHTATGLVWMNSHVRAPQKIPHRYEMAQKVGAALSQGGVDDSGEFNSYTKYGLSYASYYQQYYRNYLSQLPISEIQWLESDSLYNLNIDVFSFMYEGGDGEKFYKGSISFLPVVEGDKLIFSTSEKSYHSMIIDQPEAVHGIRYRLVIDRRTNEAIFRHGAIQGDDIESYSPNFENYERLATLPWLEGDNVIKMSDPKKYQCESFIRPIQVQEYL